MGNASAIGKKDMTAIVPFPTEHGHTNATKKRPIPSKKTAPSPEQIFISEPKSNLADFDKVSQDLDSNLSSENLILEKAPGKIPAISSRHSMKEGPGDFNFEYTEGQSRRTQMADNEFESQQCRY